MYQTQVQKNSEQCQEQGITWKTHNGGKNHDSPQAVNNHYMRGNTMTQKTQRQQPLGSFFATRGGGYTVEATTSLSLSLTVALTLCTPNFPIVQQHLENLCPKSYLYMYDFSAYLHLCPSNRSVPIGAGSVMSRFSTSSIRFHPEGHVSQQTPSSLRHGMSFQSDLLSACLQLVGSQHLGQHV